jgi:hypothetical protein
VAELELASDFAKASKSKSTQAAYSSDFRIFDQSGCRERGLTALPAMPATVCAFLAQQAGLGKRASTLGRRLAAIGYFHRLANEPSPVGDETIKATLAGIRRSIGAAPVRVGLRCTQPAIWACDIRRQARRFSAQDLRSDPAQVD